MTSRTRLRELKRKRRQQQPRRRLNPAYTFDETGLLHGPRPQMSPGDVVFEWNDERQGMVAVGRVLEDWTVGPYAPRSQS